MSMAAEGLKIDSRRKRILEMLAEEGQIQISQLSRELGVSVITIRNDLATLEKNGHLERTRGGALRVEAGNSSFGFEKSISKENPDKKQIAIMAADMVRSGEALFINSGASTYYVALKLKRHKNLNIVTNSIPIALMLGGIPGFRVLLLGGNINPQYGFTYGTDTIEQLGKYTADKSILSVSGISPTAGFTTYHAEEANMDRLMMERSRHTLIVADHSKYGHKGFYHVSHPRQNQTWITNSHVDPKACTEFLDTGMEVVLC